MPHALFLGAGASVSSGIPSAQNCIWEWKRQIFITNNPGLEDQFSEISLDGVRRRIQKWLDRQGGYPLEGLPEEYSFYIQQCFPISDDRRAFFAEMVRLAKPHIGYQLICQAAEAELFSLRLVNKLRRITFTCGRRIPACPHRSRNRFSESSGTSDPKGRDPVRISPRDYRYDPLKNTSDELKSQEEALRSALISELAETSLIVCGYSGRDASIMQALRDGYRKPGTGTLYWCGYSDGEIPAEVAGLIAHARLRPTGVLRADIRL